MKWTEEIFGTKKAVIGLVHLQPMPGDPKYDEEGGMEKVIRMGLEDVEALQDGGVDGLLFTNEFSLPYLGEMDPATFAAMAYVLGALKPYVKVPFGLDYISDNYASVALAKASGAVFTRGVFHGAWATPEGVASTRVGNINRMMHNLRMDDFKLVYYLVPESGADLAGRDPLDVLKSIYFLNQPDGLAIAGYVAGQKPDVNVLKKCREAYPDSVMFASTGVNINNVKEYLDIADGAFVGTSFKKDGVFWNQIDKNRVKAFMDKVNAFR